jgi:hypothetical protein
MGKVSWGEMNVNESAPLIEAGFYQTEVIDYEKTVAKTGTEQIKVKHRIVEGESEGATIFDWLALSDAAMWRVGSFMLACGLDLKTLPDMDTNSEAFWRVINLSKGRRLYIEVAQETNPKSGNIVNKVKAYNSVEGQEPIEYTDNVPSFIKNKQPDTATQAKLKKAGLI